MKRSKMKIIFFDKTCECSIEQYDIYDSDRNLVGYIRLCWGSLSCYYPDYDGELIYSASIGDEWTGCFESDKQRMFHLEKCAEAIFKRIDEESKKDEEYW